MSRNQIGPMIFERAERCRNASAWAVGTGDAGGFKLRRIVWGRLMARAERRPGESVRRVHVVIPWDQPKC